MLLHSTRVLTEETSGDEIQPHILSSQVPWFKSVSIWREGCLFLIYTKTLQESCRREIVEDLFEINGGARS